MFPCQGFHKYLPWVKKENVLSSSTQSREPRPNQVLDRERERSSHVSITLPGPQPACLCHGAEAPCWGEGASGHTPPHGLPTMSNGYRTLSQHLNDLKKENFSLKLRIYFLEERMQQKYEVSREDIYKRVSAGDRVLGGLPASLCYLNSKTGLQNAISFLFFACFLLCFSVEKRSWIL